MSEGPEQPEQTASAEPEPAAPDGGVAAAAPTPAVQPAPSSAEQTAQADEPVQAEQTGHAEEAARPEETAQRDETVQSDETAQPDEAVQPDETVQPEEPVHAAPAAAAQPDQPAPTPHQPEPVPVSSHAPAPAAQPAPVPQSAPVPHPVPAAPPVPAEAASSDWGRVAEDGSVFVRTAEGERQIGSWAAGTPQEGLAFYQRKFDGLKAEVELLEKRLNTTNLDAKDAEASIAKLREQLVEPHAIGDLDALRARLDKLSEIADQRRAAKREARARQQAEAAAHKERIVAEAETLAQSGEWKATGERLRALVDEWKGVPRLDRKSDDELWSRFSSARSAFAKRRKAHFAQLDAEREEVRSRKESLVEEAESLAESTEWANTAQRFRDLMKQWKAAGRAQREVEDKLWERFKTAQDTFFTARNADLDQRDAGFRENQTRKEELLAEAQKLLPVTDLKSARQALRAIQARWEEVGPVPRETKPRLEGALRDVERAVADAEQAEWKRTNPEARARAEATVRQLEASIAKFEKELDKARAAGQQRKIDDAEAALAARREWLEQAKAALVEFTR